MNTLILTDNNKSETAKKLNMSRTKLMYLLKKYNKEEVDKEIIKATEEEVKEATEKAVTQYKDVLDNLSKR